MHHETALRLIDELDSRESAGLALRLHLATCPSCAAQADRLDEALAAYRASFAPAGEPDEDAQLFEERVMAAISLTPPPRQDFAIQDWAFPALILLVSLCLLPLGENFCLFSSLMGEGSMLAIALVLSTAFMAYSALFIGTHLDELQAYLQKKGLLPR